MVSSRYEERYLRQLAEKINLRMIPKGMARLVPLEYAKNENINTFDYVYIDDDLLLRLTWEAIAKKRNIHFLSLSSTSDFRNYESQINKKNSFIYIDSNLGENEIKGEDFAIILHNEGYENIYIASGYNPEHFSHLSWLNYAGKECPFRDN